MSKGVNIGLILELNYALSGFGLILFNPKIFNSYKGKPMVKRPAFPKQYNL